MFISAATRFVVCFSLCVLWSIGLQAATAQPVSGNMVSNSSFEYDFHNNRAEGHVLAFMGDWSFNASDGHPDYWVRAGETDYVDGIAHTGAKSLLLNGDGAAARRSVIKAGVKGKPGGGDRRWGNPAAAAMPYPHPERLAATIHASAWYRVKTAADGAAVTLTLSSGGVTKVATDTALTVDNTWRQLKVSITKADIEAAHADGSAKGVQLSQLVGVSVAGQAEVFVDDVTMAEELTGPNLAKHASFEAGSESDHAIGWSTPQKYRFYTQQYYKWTSWHHVFSDIRGSAVTTDLVARTGSKSLLMQVYPGDEMLVEGELVTLNQDVPRVIEIGAFVKLDRVKWIDIQMVDQDGNEIRGVDPFTGGWPVPKDSSQIYPSNASDWVYVRKAFLGSEAIKAIRPRLCARGFNGDTRDDGGTRPNVNQVGLAWWDDVQVREISATDAELAARGVKAGSNQVASAGDVLIQSLDLGERAFGQNVAIASISNPTGSSIQATVSLALKGKDAKPASVKVSVPAGGVKETSLPYEITREDMRGDWRDQGAFEISLKGAGESRTTSLAFNTWPVIVDFDFYRHYATPDENPQTVTMNFGVAERTLAAATALDIEIRRIRDDKVIATTPVADLHQAMAGTLSQIDEIGKPDFGTPDPAQFVDRRQVLAMAMDLSAIPTRPFDAPVRDHYLRLVGKNGDRVIFAADSQPIGRVTPNSEVLPKIEETTWRNDGAVMVNGKPVFMMAGNHYTTGHYAINAAQNKSMGFNAIRWVEGVKAAASNWQANLYSLETMVAKGAVTAKSLETLAATLQAAEESGDLDGAVTIAPFYEHSSYRDTPEKVELQKEYTAIANRFNRVSNFGGGGAHNIYTVEKVFDAYDTFGLEIEPFGPPRGGYELAPILRKAGKPWFHLPQTYNPTPFDSFRFDIYATILQGGRGYSTIHGLGDPSLMRGINGEVRYLSPAIFSLDHGPETTKVDQRIGWMQRRHENKTTIIAASKPPVEIGKWTWSDDAAAPGGRSHTGVSEFGYDDRTPRGLKLHGFRETEPVQIQAGDKIIQYVRIDPAKPASAIAWGVRGDAKWDFNAHAGKAFDFAAWRKEFIHFWLGGELLPGTWQIGWQYNDATNNWFADHILTPASFKTSGDALPAAGQWTRMEMDAEAAGLVGKQIDGFYFISQNGDAQWAMSAVERGSERIVLCGPTLGPAAEDLERVRFYVPWAKDGTKVKVLFEERELEVKDGFFIDDFRGDDFFLTVRGAAIGDAVGWHAPGTHLLSQTIGYVTPNRPAAVHVYEMEQ